ncbi:serine dehydratase beta chain [Effusibacillus pohliae]|uniref:serine dehydratase beta chain n=1 Tax=Effusibacillus pohliae TaxID=232270 RepID=UPI0003799B31|nr:serine dehydratase beta chain [Effusibacillus pohliae]
MEYNSCFDIIGPVMVGPSSSHTAGVVTIGNFVHQLLHGIPERAEITFYGSFSQTYRGHGTDKAIVGGLLGMGTDDLRIKHALKLASECGMATVFKLEEECPYYDHPNTLLIHAEKNGDAVMVGGVSLGGGLSKIFLIDQFQVDIPLNTACSMVLHKENRTRVINFQVR